jgi:hypothetical protein
VPVSLPRLRSVTGLILVLSVLPVAPRAGAQSPAPAASAHPGNGAPALLERAAQYWERRKAKDLGGAYPFYCAAYKSRVSRDQYLQLTRLTRFDLTEVKVAADPAARGRADVIVEYKYRFTVISDAPLTGKTSEVWLQDSDGQWCKEDEAVVLPIPSGRG